MEEEQVISEQFTYSIVYGYEFTPEQAAESKHLRSLIEKPEQCFLWGQEHTRTPRFVDAIFGDGKKFLAVQPLNTRPDHYVIRVDSAWDSKRGDIHEVIDEIYEAIEDEYGCNDDPDEDNPYKGKGFPVLNTECGSSWWEYELRSK